MEECSRMLQYNITEINFLVQQIEGMSLNNPATINFQWVVCSTELVLSIQISGQITRYCIQFNCIIFKKDIVRWQFRSFMQVSLGVCSWKKQLRKRVHSLFRATALDHSDTPICLWTSMAHTQHHSIYIYIYIHPPICVTSALLRGLKDKYYVPMD
jgi:hypothetical protein